MENDIGAIFNRNDDKYFTHGTKFSYYADASENRKIYSLGQNIYTPSKKHADASPDDLIHDRPYTGWLYGEYRNETFSGTTKSVLGIQAGCSGPCSYAEETQSGIHKALGQNVPSWDRNYTLKSEPGFILEKEKYYDLYKTADFSTNYFTLLKAGNIVDSISFGSSFKYGSNIAPYDPEDITFKTKREVEEQSDFVYYFFGNAELRAVPYNHFLEGSLFQDERHTVDGTPLVGEADLGFRVGYNKLIFSYNYSVVTDEWEGQKGPFFWGGIDVSW